MVFGLELEGFVGGFFEGLIVKRVASLGGS